MALTILKPSFWRSEREIRDEFKMLVGKYRFTNAWQTKAEGDVEGRKLLFKYVGWSSSRSEMSDVTGNVLARIEPTGWWGMRYKLTYGGKEYQWKINGWGSAFMIYEGETEIIRVYPGGYFRPGSITVHTSMGNKDVLPLVFHGLFQFYLVAQSAAAGGGGGAS